MSYLIDEVKDVPRQSRSGHARLVSIVAVSGFVIAGLCLSLLFLLDLQSTAYSSLSLGKLTKPSANSTITHGGSTEQNESASQTEGEDDFNIRVLHPNDHVHRTPKTIRLSWNITQEKRSPDGVLKSVYLINGQFPGPVIEARSGDELIIDTYNGVLEDGHPGISVHWHGLSMEGANEMDGVVGLTQCAIQASQSFTYRFRISDHQSGTFWYHAHSATQRADGLYGGLIVHKPVDDGDQGDQSRYQYQQEQLLLVGDWYHRQADEVLEWFVDPDHYGLEPAPDSLLLNGRGHFNCSMAVKARPVECVTVDTPIVRLLNDERIRLRVVNTGVSAGFSMAVSAGSLQPITVDGGYPVNNETASAKAIGLLYPGERMDLILHRTPGHPESSANITIELDRENMPLWNFALTRTQTFQMLSLDGQKVAELPHVSKRGPPVDVLNLADITGQPANLSLGLDKQPSETAVLYSTMKIRAANHNHPVGSINHTSWITPDSKESPLLSLEREKWAGVVPQPTRVHKFDIPWFKNSGAEHWVEIVVNNFDDKGHPFHLHGYEFFVVSRSQASGTYRGYNPFDLHAVSEAKPLNTNNPLRRDTVYIPPMGYVVLRFPLSNDGLWLLHCHVLWHQAVGMGTVIQVGNISEDLKQRSRNSCSKMG